MNMQQAIAAVIDKRDLSTDEMASVMRLIMTGEATEAQIGRSGAWALRSDRRGIYRSG